MKKIELLNIDSVERARLAIKDVGVDKAAVNLMDKKSVMLVFKIYACKFYIANILKQEALSLGMDVAINRDAITAKTEYSDCLLMGDSKRMLKLADKLKKQSFRFLNELGRELKLYVDGAVSNKLTFRYGSNEIDLSSRFMVMGILNVTPDSFSDGGRYNSVDSAVKHAERMLEEGADIIDIGGESTRPGSEPVELNEELRRVVPVVEAIKKRFNAVVSVDTYKAEVAKQSINSGADIINDISGLSFDKEMLNVLSLSNCGIIAMHIKGTPKNMQNNPKYEHLLADINEYFESVINKIDLFGIDRDRLVLDPGIGFGKKYEDNLTILNNIKSFSIWNRPILIGLSKKSFIGFVLNLSDPEDRLFGSIGANVVSYLNGASILRVHDVKETVEALKIAQSIRTH